MVDGPGRRAVQRQAQDTQGQQTVKGRRTELFFVPPPFPDIEKGNIGNDQQTTDLELAVFHAVSSHVAYIAHIAQKPKTVNRGGMKSRQKE